MKACYGKGPWHSFRGKINHKVDQKVKNGKYIIQGTVNFYELSKQDPSVMKLIYLSREDYEISELFYKAVPQNL